MVSKIIVPKSISKYIRNLGIKKTKINREAVGVLFGSYDDEEDSIVISKKYSWPSKIGDSTLKGNLYDMLKILPFFPCEFYCSAKFIFHKRRLKKIGKVPAIAAYHTHPRGTWSKSDLSYIITKKGAKSAEILYIADRDEFLGINSNKENISVLID